MMDTFGRQPNSAPAGRVDSRQAPNSASGRPAADVAGERRVITVLFCDVVGSTSLASRLDPEEWAEVMNEAFQYMIAPIEEYGGMVARLMGDAVLAFFGAPQAHEDDPQRAVLAGLGIVNGIRAFARRFQEDYSLEFNVRVGINTGPVVVGEIGTSQSGEYTAMGDAINLAARMEQTATAGTVQISEDTYRLIASLFDVWDLGGIEVKGKDEPVHAYRVLGLEPQPGRQRGLDGIRTPLVGRDREVARLHEILNGLKEGKSRICYLIGEAGLGKSRLIAETRQLWRNELAATYGEISPLWRGWTEFVAVSFGASRPYDLLKRQIRNYCGIRETDAPAVIHERLEAMISLYPAALHERMHRVFGFMLGDDSPVQWEREGERSPERDGEAFQLELRSVLEQATVVQASKGPTVYVVDDVHWADVTSLEALRTLLPLVSRYPILFLFAMRPDWNNPGWQVYLEAQLEYPEYCASIYLEPLSAENSRTLLHELLGDAGAPEAVYDLIQRKAEGNPFFVEETVRTLLDSGALRREPDGLRWDSEADLEKITDLIGLPGNVQALLTARIDQLAADVRRTLQLASVIGRSFPSRVLERIADRSPEILDEHLGRLAQADLVRPAGGDGEYAFRHALTRDAAYETILLRQRRRYHRRVGETMEALFADRLTDEAPRLAYHFAEGRDWARAVRYYTMAGEAAARLYANSEAIEHYTRALELARGDRAAVDDAQLAELYRRRGRVYEVAGRYDDALRNYEELERLGVERGSPALELEGLMPQAVLYVTPTSYMDAERGGQLAERIMTLGKDNGRFDAQARAHWCLMLLNMNAAPDVPRAIEHGEQALALAGAHDLAELSAYISNDIARAYGATGRWQEAFDAFGMARRHWEALGNEPMLADTLGMSAQGFLLHGDLAASLDASREGLAVGQRIGNLWAQALNSYGHAYALLETGRLSEAVRLLWSASDLARRAGFRGMEPTPPLVLAWLYGSLGAPRYERQRLEAAMAASSAEAEYPHLWLMWQVIQRYLDGDIEGAYALIAGNQVPDVAHSGQEALFMALVIPPVALAAGKTDMALATTEAILATMDRTGIAALRADALQARGDVFRALGRVEEALADFRAAYNEARRQGARRAEWPALTALAQLETDPAQAAEYRAKAIETVQFLAGQLTEPELREAFLNRPEVRRLG